jgi:hypothetical protein
MMLSASRFIVILSVLVALAGCGRKEGDLHGTWKVDVDKAMADFKGGETYKALPEPGRKAAEDGFKAQMEKMQMIFSSGKVTMQMGELKEESEFKVTAADGDKWTVEKKEKDKTEKATIEWADDDHIVLAPEGGKSKVHLVRSK